MKSIKVILLSCILLILIFPLVQSVSGFIKEKKLIGFYQLKDRPTLKTITGKSWLDGSYQDDFAKRVEDHTGLRKTFFRILNQFDYSLFGISHAYGFICGKKGYLFEEDYIFEYTGRFFIGGKTIDLKLDRLKLIIQELKARNIDLILVFEPGKASYFPEYIPDHYKPWERSMNNYTYLTSALRKKNIPFLDLNSYFLSMKDTSRYPLFPKYGMHWSIYGMWHALDTLVKYIGKVRGTDLPEIHFGRTELSDSLRGTDNDIGEMLNVIFPLCRTNAAYPETWIEDEAVKRNLSILVVGDSYYKNIEETAASRLFGREEYWYYNSKVYPHIIDSDHPVYIDKSNLAQKLQQFNVILLTVSEINLHCMYWNFIDEAYLAFNPYIHEDPVYTYENGIRNYRDWFRLVVGKARAQHRPLERMIRLDAEYMYYLENKK